MKLSDFNILDLDEQLDTTVYDGDYVDTRIENGMNVILYQVDSFYVEIFYHPTTNVILRHRSFSCTNELSPYLDTINLEGLLD